MLLTALLVVLLTLSIYLLKKLHETNQYFKKRNVKHLKPTLLFGNSYGAFLGREHHTAPIDRVYKEYPEEDVVGHMEYIKPVYIIRSPELAYNIFVRDFAHFHDRVKASGEIRSVQDANMFILPGNIWRAVRYKFTPLFTSGKLKYMYSSIKDCWMNLLGKLDENDGKEVEMTEIMGQFSMDVIGSCAFGLDANVLKNPDSEFRQKGKEMFQGGIINNIRLFVVVMLPGLASRLKIGGFSRPSLTQYYCDVIANAMDYRRSRGLERNDFVQMLIQLKDKGKIEMPMHDKADDYLFTDKTVSNFELQLTDDILVGGAFTFLLAGFHATAMTLAVILAELAQNREIVEKIRNEIKEFVREDTVTYDELKKMTYLEKVVKEALRLFPTARTINRTCNKEYTLPNGHVLVPGEMVHVPVANIQTDPAHFPDPMKFDPDRFDVEPAPGTYMPFGEGPRICIAMRFALLELKFAVVNMVRNYDFELSEKTELPISLDPRVFLSTPKGGIFLRIKKVNKN